ncbi:hypothetical protein KMI_01g01530 [Encephalitozoon hellem]|nr:hypothetical protein KMI_01g01530 [Encephalitozoon hellem]
MKFNKLLDILKERFDVQKMPDGTYVVSGGDRRIRIREEELPGQFDVNKLLQELGTPTEHFGHIGRDDLFPDTREVDIERIGRRHPKGSFMDPSAFSPPSRQPPEDESSNQLIRIDPITPGNKRDSFEPDPDHYNPGGNGRFPPH